MMALARSVLPTYTGSRSLARVLAVPCLPDNPWQCTSAPASHHAATFLQHTHTRIVACMNKKDAAERLSDRDKKLLPSFQRANRFGVLILYKHANDYYNYRGASILNNTYRNTNAISWIKYSHRAFQQTRVSARSLGLLISNRLERNVGIYSRKESMKGYLIHSRDQILSCVTGIQLFSPS